MKLVDFYKNFNMVCEIDIAGTFIYNGIKNFDNMESFSNECDVFHVLYPLAVGIERLQKVLLVLLEAFPVKVTDEEIEIFEKSLITHSHQELHARISAKVPLEFNPHQNEFLQVLTEFYEKFRYDRFNISPNCQKDRDLLVAFLAKRLNIEIKVNAGFMNTPNSTQIKKFVGRIVGGIARTYYSMIRDQALTLNLYTYEVRYDSAAYKLFLSELKDNSFQELLFNERIALAEYLVYLLKFDNGDTTRDFIIKKVEPLDLDLDDSEIFFGGLCKGHVPTTLVDAVECQYEDLEHPTERLNMIDLLSSQKLFLR